MKVVVQRCTKASVTINNQLIGSINHGFVLLVGIESADTKEDVSWLVSKLTNLRIFSDQEGKMNLNIQDVKGEALIVSQFTLHASTKKGNRPSFIKAARPEIAIPLYELFISEMKLTGITVETGEFGADMAVELINDGPVTIIIDTQNKE